MSVTCGNSGNICSLGVLPHLTQSGHCAEPVGVSKADRRVLLQVRELGVRAGRNYRLEVDQLIDCQSMESDTKTHKQAGQGD
jgi:hypothetical protein